jgi:hypothetical protein
MTRIFLFLFALAALIIFFIGESPAQPQCEDGYSLCMANCATDRSPERCMQRCQEAERRCEKSGVFRMPIGFLLQRQRLEGMSHAEGELPPGYRRKKR